jgi:hypothetical protein
LIDQSSINLPDSALLQIADNPDFKSSINNLVIGKPVLQSDASDGGYMSGDLLGQSIQDAMSKTAQASSGQWKGGIMGWQVWLLMNFMATYYMFICPHQYHDAASFSEFAGPSGSYL